MSRRDVETSGDRWDRLLDDLARHPIEDGWVTLEEAVAATGASRSTLRSWYRSGRIPSRMVAGIHGPQRVVPLSVVIDQAFASRARGASSNKHEHCRPKSTNSANAPTGSSVISIWRDSSKESRPALDMPSLDLRAQGAVISVGSGR